jgi:hypothetical protein
MTTYGLTTAAHGILVIPMLYIESYMDQSMKGQVMLCLFEKVTMFLFQHQIVGPLSSSCLT